MTWITGDALTVVPQFEDKAFGICIADPPYNETELINAIIPELRRVSERTFVFMYAENLFELEHKPDQVLFWVKPVSTKNTTKRYSRFVEVIAAYDLGALNTKTHWSTRTGIFTDTLIEDQIHPFQKPQSLIEKLLLVNSISGPWVPPQVLDPFGGSGTIAHVCYKLGYLCTSIEIDPVWDLSLIYEPKRSSIV